LNLRIHAFDFREFKFTNSRVNTVFAVFEVQAEGQAQVAHNYILSTNYVI